MSDALAGRPALLADGAKPSEELRRALRDVYECRAVAADDLRLCDLVDDDVRLNCKARHHFFHDARTASTPEQWAGVMAGGLRDDCDNPANGIPKPLCEATEQAVREQDPSKCPDDPPPLRAMCQGIAAADPARCGDSPDCQELAGRLKMLKEGGGLARIEKEGTPRDRVSAAAALGRATACEPTAAEFKRICAERLGGRR